MIFIAFGSNLPGRFGCSEEVLRLALNSLDSHPALNLVAVSPFYMSAPVPASGQPWFYNGVAQVETALGARKLLDILHSVEGEFGRERSVRNAARVLDLDMVAYHDVVDDVDGVFVPHPRMHERAFVLLPLRDIAPQWIHPETGVPIDDLIAALPAGQEIQKMEDVHV